MKTLFGHHFRPTEKEFEGLWKNGAIVLDTNILLNPYRYSPMTRGE
ncbi:hypothetical protein [Planctomicrobium sp. SH664]